MVSQNPREDQASRKAWSEMVNATERSSEISVGSIPGSWRSPGEENGKPLQYPCLGNSEDRGAWQATVHGMAKELDMT